MSAIHFAPFVLIIVSTLTSCELFDLTPPSEYEGCCDTRPVQVLTNDDHIFIPNAITPNEDGINDQFSIYSRSPIVINDLHVYNSFQTLEIKRSNIIVEGTTDIWEPVNLNGNRVHGLFHYDMKMLNEAGDTMSITGEFCAIDCHDSNSEDVNIKQCIFRSLSDGEGGIDSTALIYTHDCNY